MKKRLLTLMSGMLIAAAASVNLYAEDTSPQQAPRSDVEESSTLITGEHPRGTWKIYKEATADKPRGLLEVYINQGKHSLCDYDEWETEEGNSSVYRRYATTAPWGSYFEYIKGVEVYSDAGNTITDFGSSAFAGLDMDTILQPGNNRVNAFNSINYINARAFVQARLPKNVSFPNVTRVGKEAFRHTNIKTIDLLNVRTLEEDAFKSENNTSYKIRQQSYVEYIDLGAGIQTIKAGALAAGSLWKYDETPSVFISNPTPPEWSRLYEESTSEAFWNALGLGLGHKYEYPFGDKPGTKNLYIEDGRTWTGNKSQDACKIIVVVPPEYLQTYIDFYPSHHPEVSEGYMCAYYRLGDHRKNSEYGNCGNLVAGKTIYSNSGEFIGWWYFDSEKNYLHIGTTDPSYTLPAYTASNAPWRAFLGQASRVILHMNKIADNAFSNGALNGVTYVEIAAKECEIGKNAFSGHSTLKYVDRYDGVVKLSIGEKAFFNCPNLESVSRYCTATSLGKSAFESCPKLNVVPTIKVMDIPENAFRGCSNLNNTYIDFSWVNTIGAQAFEGCSSSYFKEMKFGKDLTSIGTKAFKDCSSLSHIYVESANVPTTASDAFSGVTLSNITLHANGSTYADYGKHAIWGQMKADKNKVLPVGGPGEGWSISSDGTLVVYKMTGNYSSCTEQPWYSYRGFINNIIIDNGVTYISENEFSFPKAGESHVTSVSIPRSCKSIRANAFRNNDQLKTIYISSVENLGDRAFYGCSELEVIELGENLKQAGNYVFQGCVKLEKVYDYTLQAATVGDDFLTGIRTALTAAPARAPQQQQVNPNMPTLYVQDAALCNYLVANGWKDFNFGNTTEHGTIVDNGVFGNGHYILWSDGTLVCSSSEGSNVTLSGSQRTLWKNSVKRIEVIGDLTELKGYFNDLPNLEFVSLSGSIKKLDAGTFTNCTKLESIVLDNVESVGFKCFSGCTGLTKAIMPRLKEIGQNAFENTSSLEVAKTGEGCIINYQAFKNSAIQMIDLSSADLTNATGAFDNCTNLKYVAYNGTVLPQKIFMGCTALQKVDLGSNLETVLSRAFEGCTALDTIYIQCPTAPAVPTETWKENNVDVDYHGFSGLALQPIRLIVPDVYWRTYLSAPVWEDMNLTSDTRPIYADMSYPIYIPLGGGKGMAVIYDYNDGKPMTIDYEGPLPAEAHKLIDRYMPLNERAIVISDNVTEIPAASSTTNMTSHVTASEYLQIGANVKSIGGYALYNDFWDGDNFYIDCYAPVPPTLIGTSFNFTLMNEKVGNNGIKEREKVNLYIIDDDAVYDRYIHAPYYHNFNIIRNLAPSGAPQLVTVTFLDWDDRMIAQETVEWGGHVAFPADPVRQGYVFKGWSENSLNNIQADMTVRAEYYENMYTVRFFDWDNTLLKEEQVLHGHSATAPEDPVREGYMFTGWGAGWFDVTSDLDLYASYIKEGTEDIEDVQAGVISTKFIHSGQMYIRRGNAIYTIQGQRVK